jgi:hypothetical protein
MHRFRAWWLAATAAAGVGAPAATAANPPPTTLFAKWFGPAQPKKPGPVARDGSTSLRPPTVTAPLPPEVVSGALQAEQEAWARRMSVCDKLRQVALDQNDEALMRQVDDLERQATATYNARVAALGVPKVKPAATRPDPVEVAAKPDPAEIKLAADRLTAPAAPTPDKADPAVRTAAARSTDAIREVRP